VRGHDLDIDEFCELTDQADEWGITVAALPEVRREETHTPDGRVSSLVWGIGRAEVAFLHGGGLNAHTWDAVILALGRPAVAVDLPGHGHSAWRADGRYAPRTVAPAVATVLERFAPDAAAIIGHSLGGFIAIALADMRDDLVRRHVLVDAVPPLTAGRPPLAGPPPVPGPTSNAPGGVPQLEAFLSAPEGFDSRDDIVERALAFGFGPSRDAVARGVVLNTTRRGDGRWVWRHHFGQDPGSLSNLGDLGGLWPSLEAFPGPVTLVRAGRGFVSDDQVVELRRRAPAAEIVTLDTGHNVQEDDPVALAAVIDACLRS
jgi:pimeloyl-ACP methyl ester carboxylesterase